MAPVSLAGDPIILENGLRGPTSTCPNAVHDVLQPVLARRSLYPTDGRRPQLDEALPLTDTFLAPVALHPGSQSKPERREGGQMCRGVTAPC